jgi:hypothetical protein
MRPVCDRWDILCQDMIEEEGKGKLQDNEEDEEAGVTKR